MSKKAKQDKQNHVEPPTTEPLVLETKTATGKAKQVTWIEHAKKRSMWAGSKDTQAVDYYVYDEKNDAFVIESLKYPPVLLKIIDEIIVNALDHCVIHQTQVTDVSVMLNADGFISVSNNGPGIVVEETENTNGKKMYSPQLIFSEFLAGTNLDFAEDDQRIVGGQNGIGAKLTAAFSKKFIIETTDTQNKLHYYQEFNDGLATICEPIVTKSTNSGATKIAFLPDYTEFKLTIAKFYPTLYKIIESRMWQAAAYLTTVNMTFNNRLIKLESFAQFCQMFTQYDIVSTTMIDTIKPDSKNSTKNTTKSYPWDVCISVTDGKERCLSIVNGVFIVDGGTHIKHIQNHLVDNLKERIERELRKYKVNFNRNLLLNNIFIFMRGAIPSPGFLGQVKSAVGCDIDRFKNYAVPAAHWSKIWELVKPAVLNTFLKKQLGEVRTRANRGKIDVPKYREAKYCRDAKKCHDCSLIITEGDSATGTAHKGLTKKTSDGFSYDYFGIYGIQGVMMNGLKESVEEKLTARKSAKTTPKPPDALHSKKRLPNTKIIKNERIVSLMKVLGLDFHKTYSFDEAGDKEYKTLRYGCIIGLTDQDLDGYNIFGLLATFFMTYWPNLIKRNFIKRINTPVIRAYPKKSKKTLPVKEFFTEKQAKDWSAEVGDDYVANNYEIPFKFFKGLAGHRDKYGEVAQMFKNINNKICTFVLDEQAIEQMYVHYGDDPAKRKVTLATPVASEMTDQLLVPLSQQYTINTKLFQRDNIIRKLLCNIDGFVSSRRKVFYTMREHVGHKDIKVTALAGEVMSKANYHHGDASISQTIIRMAQSYKYARNLPLLLPLGEFGSVETGFKTHGAPRYLDTCMNWRLAEKMFRKEDDFILEYEVEDGKYYEPKFYVPIIPYVLCENNELPATGWAICIYARDLAAIFKNVRARIRGAEKCGLLPIWIKDFKGEIRQVESRSYFVGNYSYDVKENAVKIDELPPGTYSDSYLTGSEDSIKKTSEKKGIQAKEWVEDFEDETSNERGVDIVLYLKEGAREYIEEHYNKSVDFDCFEEYFELKQPIHNRINLVDPAGNVIEYKTYEQVFDDWFEYRKNLYAVRIEREIIINDFKIKMLQNMQRFSKEHDKYNITKKTTEVQAIGIIADAKYTIFNKSLLENPQYCGVRELKQRITSAEHGASYNYLLALSYKELTEDAFNKREERIKELMVRQQYLKSDDEPEAFIGARIWLKELDELEDMINKGMASDWFYGDNNFKFEDDDTEPVKRKIRKIKKPRTKTKDE